MINIFMITVWLNKLRIGFVSIVRKISKLVVFGALISSAMAAEVASPFYVGAALGYASTDWSMLVTSPLSVAAASAPIGADDKGISYGFLAGYHVNKHFALEANYFHLNDSTIHFRAWNDYWPLRGTATYMSSETSVYALDAKFFVPVTFVKKLSGYASVGLGTVHRQDELADTYRMGGVFGAGLDYALSSRISTELAFQYYTGFGSAKSVNPAYDYVPFVYQAYADVTYHFAI
jgi:opacity protein-like surface antigen